MVVKGLNGDGSERKKVVPTYATRLIVRVTSHVIVVTPGTVLIIAILNL